MRTTPATRRTLLVVGAIALIGGYGVILSYVSHHLRLSAWVVGGLVTFVLLKHVGLVGVLLAWLRAKLHRSRSEHSDNGAARATSQGSDRLMGTGGERRAARCEIGSGAAKMRLAARDPVVSHSSP